MAFCFSFSSALEAFSSCFFSFSSSFLKSRYSEHFPTYPEIEPSSSKIKRVSAILSIKYLSWETIKIQPAKSCKKLSKIDIVKMSKSLVGSSKTKKFGFDIKRRTKNKRFRSPPERLETGEYWIFPSKPNCSSI